MVFVAGLSTKEKKLVEAFKQETGCKVMKNFDSQVTHVICGNDSSGSAK